MSGKGDNPVNYHHVTYELNEKGGTTTLTLTQGNSPTQQDADSMVGNRCCTKSRSWLNQANKAFTLAIDAGSIARVKVLKSDHSPSHIEEYLVAATLDLGFYFRNISIR